MVLEKVVWFSDEENDDFANIVRDTAKVGAEFPFIHENPFWNAAAFFVHGVVMRPFAFVFCKIKFGLRFSGADKVKPYAKSGFFIYGNHTQIPADAFIPNMLRVKKPYFIVHPDNISLKGTKNIMQMLGAVPLPTGVSGYKSFLEAVSRRYKSGHSIVVFPEAHVWPYYTGIRPFRTASFHYPAKLHAPSFCFTVTYQKRKYRKLPRITVFVDGPFYADHSLKSAERDTKLMLEIHSVMEKRAENSNTEYIVYKRRQPDD